MVFRIRSRIHGNFRIKITLGLVLVLIIPMVVSVSLSWAKPPKSRAQWTFMVYMDADNNLDYYGELNMDAMKEVGSTQDVNIIVLWDKYDDVANLYKVSEDEAEIVTGFRLNGKEVNMGDPYTLQTFVEYTMNKFHSNHYALVLWDHGDDFRGCCWDDHPYGHLTHQNITQALSGIHLDILAYDACVEGMIEVAYEYVWARKGPQIDYIVATEGYVPNWGYPYTSILNTLASNPDLNAFEFSKLIVDEYIAFYEALRPASRHVELAAIDLTLIPTIVQQLGELTDILEEYLDDGYYHEEIAIARGEGNLGWSEYGWDAHIDLPTFVKTLDIPDATTLCEKLNETLTEAIYVNVTEPMKSAEGLGIFFPNSYGSFQNNVFWHGDEYLYMQFPHEGWWDFLQAYWGK